MFSFLQDVPFILVLFWLVTYLSPSRGEQHQHIHRVLAIGLTDEKLMVITGPLRMINGYPLLYTLPESALNDKKGQLYLKGVVPIPIGDKWTNFSSTQLSREQKLLAHSVTYWDQETRQLFLMLDYNDNGNTYNTVVIGLQSSYLIERPQSLHSFVNDAWISTYEPMTFYLIKNGHKDEKAPFLGAGPGIKHATRIAKAKCETAVDSNHTQISNLNQSTNYFTICKVSDDPKNNTIFLSIDARCLYPVNWGVTSGFVDSRKFFLLGNGTAYFFDKSLFDNALIEEKGLYMSRTFEEFLYTNHTLPPSVKSIVFSLPKWGMVLIALGIVAVITAVLFLLYCFCDCGTQTNSNLETATSSNAKGDSANSKSGKKAQCTKKPSPIANKKSKQTKKTKKSKKPASYKTKTSKKSAKKSVKKPQMDLEVQMGSDQLPMNLSQKMPSLKTNDANEGDSQKLSGKKSTKSSNKGKMMNGKMAQSIKPLAGNVGAGPLLKKLNAGNKQPLTKISGKLMTKGGSGKQPASFKTSTSKKTKGASMNSKMPEEGGSLRPQPSLDQGRSKREEDNGSMRGEQDE